MKKIIYFCDLCEKEYDEKDLNFFSDRELGYFPFDNLSKKDENLSVLKRSPRKRKLEHLCKDCLKAYEVHKELIDNLGSTLFYIRNERELKRICGTLCSPQELREELVKELILIQKVWGN